MKRLVRSKVKVLALAREISPVYRFVLMGVSVLLAVALAWALFITLAVLLPSRH